ncbi:MAG: hypothetical protein NTV30_10150 [Chloroflexi bacterium]|nr:hypothetical protein [Chloroflexota bacterium]
MVKIEGKFITMGVSLMILYPYAQILADEEIFSITGKHWTELEPEGWYDHDLYTTVQEIYTIASLSKDIITLNHDKNVLSFN